MSQGLRVHDEGSVRWITIDRPDAANAIDTATAAALKTTLMGARLDASVSSAVLTGAASGGEQQHFCSGLDQSAGTAAQRRADLRTCLGAILDFPKPLIASVNGDATGAGALLAFVADQRVMAEDASFTLPEIALNLPNYPALAILRERVGTSLAAELVLSGRAMSAPEARMWNLCLACAPGDLTRLSGLIASSFSGKPAEAFRLNKAWINGHLRTVIEAAVAQEEQSVTRA
jgi:enoyl-CoA hydratase/carnithine racemase